MCVSCFIAVNGWEPEMGDQGTHFKPGTCTRCGADQITFHLTDW